MDEQSYMTKTMCDVVNIYLSQGYAVTKIFFDEYILMVRKSDGLKVRVFFNGKLLEYGP